MDEINKIQEERGLIYGDFREHCEKVSYRMRCNPIQIALFYIFSKAERWNTCQKKINRDSLIDLLSYIDLTEKNFKNFIDENTEKDLLILKMSYEKILSKLDGQDENL